MIIQSALFVERFGLQFNERVKPNANYVIMSHKIGPVVKKAAILKNFFWFYSEYFSMPLTILCALE